MTCETVSPVWLYFMRSDFWIQPVEVDVRKKNVEFGKGKFELTEQDGHYVSENAAEAEPVMMTFGQWPVHRFVMPSIDSMEYHRNLEGITKATLTLLDGRAVLQRGTINKNWERVELGNAVEYIVENRNDPSNVMSGEIEYSGVSPTAERDDLDLFGPEAASVVPEALGLPLADDVESQGDITDIPIAGETLQDFAVGTFETIEDNTSAEFSEEALFSGFEFNGISPLEALGRVVDEFNIQFRVRNDGTLVVGPPGGYGRVGFAAADSDSLSISRYDVTQSSNQTDTVYITGSYTTTNFEREGFLDVTAVDYDETQLQAHAEATAPSIEGSAIRLEKSNIQSLTNLEDVASWKLLSEIMQDTTGSIQFNGSASTNTAALALMDVGDWLFVAPDVVESDCSTGVVAGAFIINEVQHKVGDTRGWKTTVEVSRITPANGIETTSYYYDPSTDQRFESLEAFNEYREQREAEEGFGEDSFSGFTGLIF